MNIYKNLELQVENLKKITNSIERNQHIDDLANKLMLESFYPKRLEVISEILFDIKVSIDIDNRFNMPYDVLNKRTFVIDLAIATENLVKNIRCLNDDLVRAYNKEVIEILSRS